jgi:DNA (cytosine-5)-methyltransferase 1
LCARQNDKILPPFPIWDDVQTFDGNPWRGIVDVVSGGFPCQDISAAGKGAGIEGNKSSMWKHMARIIGEVRPQYVFVENSPMLTSRGLGVVLADLSKMGFDAKWGVVSAADVGANHLRERIWIRAVCNANNTGLQRNERVRFSSKTRNKSQSSRLSWWSTEPDVLRVANGIPARVDRLKAIGNGQVPLCAATAWELLK